MSRKIIGLRHILRFLAWTCTVMVLAWPIHARSAGVGKGTEAEVMVPGSVGETVTKEDRPMESHDWTYPSWGYQGATNYDQIFLAFPQPDAIFPNNSIITLGWQPYAENTIPVDRYEILISNDKGLKQRLNLGQAESYKSTTHLFMPPEPAKYFWQVWAFFPDGSAFASVGRYFTVKQ